MTGLKFERAREVLTSAKADGRNLYEHEAYQIVSEWDPDLVPQHRYARDLAEAEVAFERLAKPVVMKVVSRDILHKSDAGGVILGIDDIGKCRKAWDKLQEAARNAGARFEGALVVPQAQTGLELIVGAMRDKEFGPVVMVGPGGILVEVIRTPTFFVAPVQRQMVFDGLSQGVLGRILGGVRGGRPLDKEALAGAVEVVSELICRFPEISEIDLNPVVTYPTGCKVLDARIVLS